MKNNDFYEEGLMNGKKDGNGDEDCIVTLCAADGTDVDFYEIAGIAHKGNFYAILQPVELLEGMGEDEALVFKVTRKGGEDHFEIELDDDVIQDVFDEYNCMCDEAGIK